MSVGKERERVDRSKISFFFFSFYMDFATAYSGF
jgi:hypothetical protein